MHLESERRRLVLGIEIGGTKLQLGIGHGDGKIIALERRVVDPSQGAEGIRGQIQEASARLISSNPVRAVGIGFGGPVDAVNGVVTISNQIQGWKNYPLAEWVRQTLGISRVAVQNDADTAALGEARFGAGMETSPVLYVTVGSGIGGGLIVDGKIYRGSGRGAVEIGHLQIDEGPSAGESLEMPRTLESISSGWSIGGEASRLVAQAVKTALDPSISPLLRLCEGNPQLATAIKLVEAAEAGDQSAIRLLRSAALAISKALAHAVTLLAPQRIILGGGVSLMPERFWLEPIRQEVERRVFSAFRGTYDIVPPLLGEEVVVHGALALAHDLCPA